MAKKKKKETFKTFRNLEKSKFKTIKTTLKSVLLKHFLQIFGATEKITH